MGSAEPKTILIADDSATSVMQMTVLLRPMGFHILAANDGLEALRLIGQERPDLVLLDLNMPQMDGYTVLRQLKANKASAAIPVIIITTEGSEATKRFCAEQGCQGYMTKPVTLCALNKIITENLAQHAGILEAPPPVLPLKSSHRPSQPAGATDGSAQAPVLEWHASGKKSMGSQHMKASKQRVTRCSERRPEQELIALRAVAAACIEEMNEDTLIEKATDIICKAVYITNFGIILYDEKSGRLHDHPSCRRREGIACLHLALGEGIVGTVAKTGRPMRVPDVRREPLYRTGDTETLSELTVPLRVGEQLIGVINTENKELNAFSEADEHLLMILAGQLAPAIARLRAVEAIRDREERYRTLYESNPSIYLTINAVGAVLSVNRFGAEQLGYKVEELAGRPMEEIVHEKDRAEFKARLAWRVREPGRVIHGEFRMVRKDGDALWARESAHAIPGGDGTPVLLVVCEDITEQKRAEERSKESVKKLKKMLDETVQALARVVEVKDPYTSGHQRRVAQLVTEMGAEMGLPTSQVESLRVSGLLHDIGKVHVPAEILSKPGELSEAERSLIRTHSKVGYELLKGVSFEGPVANIVLQHHERMDGSGYPNAISGGDILLEARILGVADVVEALSSHRPYRPAFGLEYALKEISALGGTAYDPDVVRACLKMFRKKHFRFT